MENPFKYGTVVRGAHFANRDLETAELFREMRNLGRVFLISPRRYGKTCLLMNLMDRLREKGFFTAYVDLNAYPDLPGFASAFTETTSSALESNIDKLIKIFLQFKRLRPKMTVGPDGNMSASLELATDSSQALPALLEGMRHADELARQKRKKLVIAIDEFSDIPKYDGETLEKAMRSEIQKNVHVGYIFSGSEQSLMIHMTRDKKRAFYKLGRLMELGPIRREHYIDFVNGWLRKGGYRFKKKDLTRIFELGTDVPYNIQRMCHALWETARESRNITPSLIEEIPFTIADQESPHFEILWQAASQQQKMLLIALSNRTNNKPFSKAFQLEYGVGPTSSIKASLDSLVKKGILFKAKEGTYQFSDTFMRYWIMQMRR